VAALAACGGGSDDEGSVAATSSAAPTSTDTAAPSSAAGGASDAGSSDVQAITATEADFSISLDQDTLPAGDYEITVANDGRANHDLVVERDGNDVAGTDGVITPGGTGTFTVTLEPGEYVFYCSVGNHRTMGMELTVQVT
jgi:plastocyanin